MRALTPTCIFHNAQIWYLSLAGLAEELPAHQWCCPNLQKLMMSGGVDERSGVCQSCWVVNKELRQNVQRFLPAGREAKLRLLRGREETGAKRRGQLDRTCGLQPLKMSWGFGCGAEPGQGLGQSPRAGTSCAGVPAGLLHSHRRGVRLTGSQNHRITDHL